MELMAWLAQKGLLSAVLDSIRLFLDSLVLDSLAAAQVEY
jgi:hypothetical protein